MARNVLRIITLISIFIAQSALSISSICTSVTGDIPKIYFNELTDTNIAKALGWVRDKNVQDLCQGYYLEPDIITKNPHPKNFKELPVNVKASNPAFFSQYGQSVLQGNVTITQTGREVTADKVTMFRDNKTGKLSSSTLVGNVHLREYGKLLVAQEGYLDFSNKIYKLNNVIYRLLTPSPTGFVNAWGKAKQILNDAPNILKLEEATYSSCPPDNNTWQLASKYLVLDKNSGRGTAKNTVLYVKKVPVFYAPYFTFPIDKRRKSGFLFPSYAYSNDSGISLSIPYYFNLAPNYDFTLTPGVITKRGILTQGDFRYLTQKNSGTLDLAYIPYDKAFNSFKDEALYSNPPSHSLSQLEGSSNWRGYVGFKDSTNFNPHWTSSIDINRVSDDYYLQDFGGIPSVIDNDQLLNEGDLNYANENWLFHARLQDFQTLHPLTTTPIQDQYRRLPQLDLTGDYPNNNSPFDYRLESQFVNFDHHNDFYTGQPVVSGRRLHIVPGIKFPYEKSGSYFIPNIQLDTTNYAMRNQTSDIGQSTTRVLPLFSLDSGMTFSRNMEFFHNSYMQTLEPRLFYIYVPYKNQNDIQNFDTTLPGLDFSQLFRVNRFSSYDRIGDANQFTLALTSRLLDYNGDEKLNFGIGEIVLLHKHRVFLPNYPDPLGSELLSPLVGQLQYYITRQINTSANIAWDPNFHQFDTANLNLQYNSGENHIVNLWYNFTREGDPVITLSNVDKLDLNRIGISLSWQIVQKWNLLGDFSYNISHKHTLDYFYGVEYESCCFAIRFVQSNTFINVDANGNNTYKPAFYLQVLLKGLGNFGVSDAGSLLTSQIPGFQDKFASGFRL